MASGYVNSGGGTAGGPPSPAINVSDGSWGTALSSVSASATLFNSSSASSLGAGTSGSGALVDLGTDLAIGSIYIATSATGQMGLYWATSAAPTVWNTVSSPASGWNNVSITARYVQFWIEPFAGGSRYVYSVCVASGSGGGGTVYTSTAVTSPPTSPTAQGHVGRIVIAYTASSTSGVTYNLYQGTTPGGEGGTAVQAGVSGLSMTVLQATPAVRQYFTVSATLSGVESTKSGEVNAISSAQNWPV